MFVLYRHVLLLMFTGVLCFGDITVTATNPNFPNESSDGSPVVNGTAAQYGIQSATLSDIGTAWTLTVKTNYPVTPNATGAIQAFCGDTAITNLSTCVSSGNLVYFMSDFLIEQGGTDYGIILSSHAEYPHVSDTYTAGDLYSASSTLPGLIQSGPVILGPGGTQLNTGSTMESAVSNPGCTGLNCAEFTITDKFTAPVNFFNTNAPYTIIMSSADCDNEFINSPHTVPEPSGLVWLMPALLLAGFYLRRHPAAEADQASNR